LRFERLWIGLKGRALEAETFIKTVHGVVKAKFCEKAAQDFKESSLLFRAEEWPCNSGRWVMSPMR